MKQRRRLGDLFVRGQTLDFDDGSNDPITVWIQKLSPIDRATALRRAQAARARFMLETDDESTEAYQAIYGDVRDWNDRDGLISLIIAEDVGRARTRVEAELASDEESWGKDSYLQGLFDAWLGDPDNPGLSQTMAEDPEDPEAKRVLAELNRFEDSVAKATRLEAERLRADWGEVPDDVLWRKATRVLLEGEANKTFQSEFERQQMFFAVRDPENQTNRYFASVAEADDLDDRVRDRILQCLKNLNVSVLEGKDSRASQDSSNSSEPSPAEETSPPSGPEAVSA